MVQPYLCACGSVMNVAEIPSGGLFKCPTCGSQQHLDAADPSLLDNQTEKGGMYDLLLAERFSDESQLESALLVADGDAAGDASNASSTTGPTPESDDPERTIINTDVPRSPTLTEPHVGSDTRDAPAPMPPTLRLDAGEKLGPFRIERILGQGGMGTVYEAFDTSLHRRVALKVLAEEHARDRETVDRFQREARSAGSLTHPNITHIYSIGENNGYHYFAMELVAGQTLAEVLHATGPVTEEDCLDYLLQIARGLRAAKQKGIIHRDIKPSNLIRSGDGLVKITDFGLAKVVTNAVEITATGVIIGTPLYMSPEQGRGEPLDHRTDIYSLGCSFFHLLSGRPPYSGENAMAIIVRHVTDDPPELPEATSDRGRRLRRVIHRMIQKEPHERFQNYEELIEALSQAGSTTSSVRIDADQGRTVLVSELGEEDLPADSLSLKLLSVADVSMELGRHEKALSLYEKVIADNPQLETDLSFRMLKIYQQQGDEEKMEELYRKILASTEDVNERYFCRWKLLMLQYRRFETELDSVTAQLEGTLADPSPEGVSSTRFQQRLRELQELQKGLRRDQEEGVTLIRRTGDLQIELE